MDELQVTRNEINKIDDEMATLFEKRMQLCKGIAEYKMSHALPVRDKAREADVIAAAGKKINEPVIAEYYTGFIKNVMSLSCDYQTRLMNGMKIGYSGVEGAFAYIAAKRMYPHASLIAYDDFASVYAAVENGEIDAAVMPIENSYAGEVGTVMDLIFSGSLYINQVADVEIVQNLIGVRGASVDTVKTVISHPQALTQCDGYIRAHGYEAAPYSNTAAAALHVKNSGDITVAAIASAESAEIFGLKVLDAGINQSNVNTTRFASLSRALSFNTSLCKREDESFSLMFTVQNEAGSLAQTLNILGAHGYNMRSLRSRPMKGLLWTYYFYVEAEGAINTENGRDMLNELSAVCAKLKIVGSYCSDITI